VVRTTLAARAGKRIVVAGGLDAACSTLGAGVIAPGPGSSTRARMAVSELSKAILMRNLLYFIYFIKFKGFPQEIQGKNRKTLIVLIIK